MLPLLAARDVSVSSIAGAWHLRPAPTVFVILALLVFVPIRYLYPSRTPTARRTTYVLGGVWAICLVY